MVEYPQSHHLFILGLLSILAVHFAGAIGTTDVPTHAKNAVQQNDTISANKSDVRRGRGTKRKPARANPTPQPDQALKDKDAATAGQNQAIKDRDAAVAGRDQAIKDRDAAVAALKDKDTAIAVRDHALQDKDTAIAERDQAQKAKDAANPAKP